MMDDTRAHPCLPQADAILLANAVLPSTLSYPITRVYNCETIAAAQGVPPRHFKGPSVRSLGSPAIVVVVYAASRFRFSIGLSIGTAYYYSASPDPVERKFP